MPGRHVRTISDWKSLLEQLSALSGRAGLPRILCRGQPREGELVPSAGRLLRTSGWSHQEQWRVERRAVREFERKLPEVLRAAEHRSVLPLELRIWPLMQHHGAPTRLLDWTWSPYVAVYYAACSAFDEDGVLFAFRPRVLRKWARLRAEHEAIPVLSLQRKVPRDGFYQMFAESPPDPPLLYIFEPRSPSPRQSVQQGVFTIATSAEADHAALIDAAAGAVAQEASEPAGLLQVRIAASAKPAILHELHAMNVGPHSLFPGIDGVGRHVRETLELMIHLRPDT